MAIKFNKYVKSKKLNAKPMSKKARRITLIVFCVIYAVVLLGIIFVQTSKKSIDKSVETFCFDDYDVFSSTQELELNENCKNVQKKYGINVYISTCMGEKDYWGDIHATQWGTSFLAEHGLSQIDNLYIIILNCIKNGNIVVEYHFDIYKYGHAAKKLTESEADKIIWSNSGDEIVSKIDLSTETRVKALKQMTIDLGIAYSWIYTDNWGTIVIVTLLIGALIAFIVVKIIKSSYSKARDNQSYSFSANSNLNLTIKQDVYSHKHVTSVRISSSSSGGGGGHSSGGGGGSGHAGGR